MPKATASGLLNIVKDILSVHESSVITLFKFDFDMQAPFAIAN